MANTFKNKVFNGDSSLGNSDMAVYTVPSSTTTVVIGLVIANIHTAQVTATVKLVSDTSGGGRAATNTTTHLIKAVPIPVGSSIEVPLGGKLVLETTDKIQIDCSVADKVSVTMSIMEIT